MPVTTTVTRMYSTVTIARPPSTPRGTARCGFLVSSAVVATTSKPMNAKNTSAAPDRTPMTPYCDGSKPDTMTNSVIATLMIVKMLFTRVLSLVPTASSAVNTATTSTGPQSRSTGPSSSVVGTSMPNSPNASDRYTPQNFAITAAASSISRIRSQPMIHATSSPAVA